MRTARLSTVPILVATTRCQYWLGMGHSSPLEYLTPLGITTAPGIPNQTPNGCGTKNVYSPIGPPS